MASKDKYWPTGYPLVVTCLCVSPREIFMEQWQACLASGLAKLKVRRVSFRSLLKARRTVADLDSLLFHRTVMLVLSSPTPS